MCTDNEAKKYEATKDCIKSMNKFYHNNKNAQYFEVIGMIAKDDFISSEFQNDILKTGLAVKRARTVIWSLRNTNNTIKVFPVSYYITSPKNYKGTVIRAYQ